IARCNVANRPERYEPRVKKKRGTNYNLMMQPRDELRGRLKEGDNSFEQSSYRNDCAIRATHH
ncbi:MAG: hypothetical protein AAFU85_09990, partial [Planctomycetota bacterium]